jgi:Ca2+-binding RTX toxin-like protein
MSDPISTNFSVVNTTTSSTQELPQTAVLNDGSYIITWDDISASPDVIRFQRFDAAGNRLGLEQTIPAASNATAASITALNDGGFIITYDFAGDQQHWARYATADATTPVASGVFSADKAAFDAGADIIQAPDGTVWVAWDDGTAGTNIRVDRYTPEVDGTMTFLTTDLPNLGGSSPNLTVLASGQVALVYHNVNSIEYIVYNADGTDAIAQTSFVTPNGNSSFNDIHPVVTGLANGALLMTWTAANTIFPAVNVEVFGQIFIPGTFTAYDAPFIVSTNTPGAQSHQRIVALDDGGFIAFYTNAPELTTYGNTSAIAAQRFDGLGNAIGPVVNISGLPIETPDVSEGINLDVTLLDDGRILVVFVSDDVQFSDGIIQVILDLRNSPGEGIVLGDITASDVLYGTSQNEAFDGRGGDDTIYAGDGHDRLFGGTGEDLLVGGAGNDTLEGGFGADELLGDAGNDWASYAASSTGVLVTIGGSGVGGAATGDILRDIENLIGSQGADELRGDTNANTIDGQAGNDLFLGNGGDDVLFGNAGNDAFVGGQGGDFMDGGDGIDRVSYSTETGDILVTLGGSGLGGQAEGDAFRQIENITAGSGDDELRGDDEANLFFGQAGNDLLFGGGGNDELRGGDDNDVLVGGAGADFLRGYDGVDRVSYSTSSTGVTIDLSNVRAATGGDALGDTFSSIERVTGSMGGDDIRGNTGSNVIDGYLGNDTLNGGTGNDGLIGGGGVDTFEFFNSFGVDRIIDFDNGTEMVDMTGNAIASAGTLNVNIGGNGNVIVDFGTADSIEFTGITNAALITADDFIF